ncbi:FAD-binding protein [Kocuria palustris]
MLDVATEQGVRLVNRDRMWHSTEGLQNWDPVWPDHAIRILPGPSSVWLDARGRQLPAPGLPGYDTLGTLELLLKSRLG